HHRHGLAILRAMRARLAQRARLAVAERAARLRHTARLPLARHGVAARLILRNHHAHSDTPLRTPQKSGAGPAIADPAPRRTCAGRPGSPGAPAKRRAAENPRPGADTAKSIDLEVDHLAHQALGCFLHRLG